jgi:hypothetical protein
MGKESALNSPVDAPSEARPKDRSRLEMMRRIKRMTLNDRIQLFERLSRDAAWARSATRVR